MKRNIPLARCLRRAATDSEVRLWAVLRNRQLFKCKFRRQYPIGPFVADFACVERRLIVEADGGQHCKNARDDARTEWLKSENWRVLRFWNYDILTNTEAIQETILAVLEGRTRI